MNPRKEKVADKRQRMACSFLGRGETKFRFCFLPTSLETRVQDGRDDDELSCHNLFL